MADIIAEIRKVPPVTRFLVGSSLGVTLSTLLGIVSPYTLIFVTPYIVRRWELWRLHTSFFLGGRGLDYIFELVMLYRNSNSLESEHYRGRSSDYAWQLLFVCTSITLANRPLGSLSHHRAFIHAITYLTCSLTPPGALSSIMGFITIPVTYLPYAMLGMDLLIGGMDVAAQSVSGIVVGHLWWWLVWGAGTGAGGTERGPLAHYGRAPRWFRNWFGEREIGRTATIRDGFRVFAPGPDATRSTGHRWGTGQRLGS